MEENQNPKSNKGIFIVIGIMAIVIIALVGYIVYSNSNSEKEVAGNNTNTSLSNKSDKDVDENKDSKDDEEDDEDDKKNTSKNSTFGKKDKNETNTEANTSKDSNTTNTSKDNNETNTGSTLSTADWKSGEFKFDGVAYKLNSDYKNLIDNGWSVNLADAGYEDGYILNKNDKTYSTANLENDKYDDADVSIGFINLGDSAKDVSECQFWAISVDNQYSDTPVEFELPGGIKPGASLADIEAVYGKPADESNIYRSEDLKYTKYTYESDDRDTPMLELTVFDEDGLTEFDYKIY